MKNAIKITKQSKLLKKDYEMSDSMIRINNTFMNKCNLARYDWVAITSEHVSKPLYRQVYGSSYKGLDFNTIMIDYDGRQHLCSDKNKSSKIGSITPAGLSDDERKSLPDEQICSIYEVEWKMVKVPKYKLPLVYWNYPNQGYRVSLQIALISVLVGFTGALLGLLSLAFSLF